jgi:hypothetical protein
MNLVRIVDTLEPVLYDLIKNEGIETKVYLNSYQAEIK